MDIMLLTRRYMLERQPVQYNTERKKYASAASKSRSVCNANKMKTLQDDN